MPKKKLTMPGNGSFARKRKAFDASMKMFEELVLNVRYRAMFIARAIEGELHPSLEKMMYEYILGKPDQTVNLNVNENAKDYTAMTEEQILEERVGMHDRLLELRRKKEELESKENGQLN